MTRVLLIRHAESLWNAKGLWQGWGDPELSPRGRGQAETLGRELAQRGVSIDVLVASSLRRALETAERVGSHLQVPVLPDPRLRELRVGSWEGKTRSDVERLDAEALSHFDSGDPLARAGGGETLAELAARTRPAVAEHLENAGDGCLALVLHLGVLRTLLPGRKDLANAGYVEVERDELVLDPRQSLTPVPHGRVR